MRKIINKITQYWLSDGQIDSIDWVEDSIFWTIGALKGIKLKWDREFKKEFFDETCYVDFKHDFENVTVMELNDDYLKVLAFDDGYEGYEIILTEKDGKLSLKNSRLVGDEECNVYGMDESQIKTYLDNE